MAESFATVDSDTLRILSVWRDPDAQPLRPRRPRGRHGRVTVRYEEPAAEPAATRADMLKAAVLEERNWAWGQDEHIGRYRQHR